MSHIGRDRDLYSTTYRLGSPSYHPLSLGIGLSIRDMHVPRLRGSSDVSCVIVSSTRAMEAPPRSRYFFEDQMGDLGGI